MEEGIVQTPNPP